MDEAGVERIVIVLIGAALATVVAGSYWLVHRMYVELLCMVIAVLCAQAVYVVDEGVGPVNAFKMQALLTIGLLVGLVVGCARAIRCPRRSDRDS